MKLYVLERKEYDYDEVASLAILARDENEARMIAFQHVIERCQEYYAREFLDPEASTCKSVEGDKPGVVLEHFLYG